VVKIRMQIINKSLERAAFLKRKRKNGKQRYKKVSTPTDQPGPLKAKAKFTSADHVCKVKA